MFESNDVELDETVFKTLFEDLSKSNRSEEHPWGLYYEHPDNMMIVLRDGKFMDICSEQTVVDLGLFEFHHGMRSLMPKSPSDKCPYCHKQGFVPEPFLSRTLVYGSGTDVVLCRYCSGKVSVTLHRKIVVEVTRAEKTSAVSLTELHLT